jgi:RNA polymerase sigma-70 factor (ECF subfamily)
MLTDREDGNGATFPDHVFAARSSNPRATLEQKELGAAINQALAKLPRRLATAFSLYETEDWSGREICDALNISENNLWITLHRARKQLRAELAPWHARAI